MDELQSQIDELEDRISSLENAPPEETQDQLDDLEVRLADLEDAELEARLEALEILVDKMGEALALQGEKVPASFPDFESFALNGENCTVCDEPQRTTPSGDICKNGHGGAPGKPSESS